ncbi:hypothetical protein VTI28DRAFT_6111 [Corynascus sepedonium]
MELDCLLQSRGPFVVRVTRLAYPAVATGTWEQENKKSGQQRTKRAHSRWRRKENKMETARICAVQSNEDYRAVSQHFSFLFAGSCRGADGRMQRRWDPIDCGLTRAWGGPGSQGLVRIHSGWVQWYCAAQTKDRGFGGWRGWALRSSDVNQRGWAIVPRSGAQQDLVSEV